MARGAYHSWCHATRSVWDAFLPLTVHSLELDLYNDWFISIRFQSQVDGNWLFCPDDALKRAKMVGDCIFIHLRQLLTFEITFNIVVMAMRDALFGELQT